MISRKLLLSILFLWILNFNVVAQSDSLELFRQPVNGKEQGKLGSFKNALNFNLFQILRGSALLSYECLIGKTGLAATAGIGICKFDAIGQVYLRELSHYYNSGAGVSVTKAGTKIRPITELGLKFYTDDNLGRAYIGLAFTSINNTVNLKHTYGSTTLASNLRQLDYRSNDFKIMFGVANRNDKKFYHDVSFGAGYRFIKYEYLAINDNFYTSQNSSGSEALIKKEGTNQTIWIFTAWRMGIRF
jgi:hypothetical protein